MNYFFHLCLYEYLNALCKQDSNLWNLIRCLIRLCLSDFVEWNRWNRLLRLFFCSCVSHNLLLQTFSQLISNLVGTKLPYSFKFGTSVEEVEQTNFFVRAAPELPRGKSLHWNLPTCRQRIASNKIAEGYRMNVTCLDFHKRDRYILQNTL